MVLPSLVDSDLMPGLAIVDLSVAVQIVYCPLAFLSACRIGGHKGILHTFSLLVLVYSMVVT